MQAGKFTPATKGAGGSKVSWACLSWKCENTALSVQQGKLYATAEMKTGE